MIIPVFHRKNLAITALALAIAAPGIALADPILMTEDPVPPIFCMRITDIERVSIGDGTANNDFALQFEILNWTDTAASGFSVASTIGSTDVNGTNPTIYGIGVDRDGRGGALGGMDIDATGAGITEGAGTFDPTAIHSGRGRGDIPDSLNDWSGSAFNATSGLWGEGAAFGTMAGTTIDPQDLVAAGVLGGQKPIDLIPSQTPPYAQGDVDLLGDSSIDGGPGTFVMDDPIADGTMNQLDGFTMTIQDWDVGEQLSLNWFLLDSFMETIGTDGIGNRMGFGLMNLVRIPVGGALPGAVFQENTGFIQNNDVFYDYVYSVPNPAEFAVELGIGITGAFANPNDNIFNARVNTTPVSAPVPIAMIAPGLIALLLVRRRRTQGTNNGNKIT